MDVDPFRLCVALGPVAIYLVMVGALNLSRRALLVTGTRDAAALGLAISGMILVGPLELFFPEAALDRLGPTGPLVVLGTKVSLCAMLLVLALLMLRPRLIVYNISADQLRSILAETVSRLDAAARWAGDSLAMPALGVQLHLDSHAATRNVALVSCGAQQDFGGWRKLERALAAALAGVPVKRNLLGIPLLVAGVTLLAALATIIARNPQTIAHSLFEMLQM
ncbi:MAG: hypothetical protein ACLQLG_04335 [Thermoguttaceae bacterium]